MCGFVGLADPTGLEINLATLRSCRDTLLHRGPDSSGEYCDQHVYLGFRRLAILDVSPEGDQPMAAPTRDVWIVFNGEIYNYVELRRDLKAKGHQFHGNSDTEVLVHLYNEYGLGMLGLLNGMFAIAIYDQKQNCIFLIRDRLGKKPLYYWLHRDRLAWASEIRALRDLPGFPRELDYSALGLYFRLGWVPNWACIYPGIHKLPPASWLKFSITEGKIEGPNFYWKLPQVQIEREASEEEWLDRIEEILWDATRIRLRSDVPLGVFLSGGIDSALVTTAAAYQTRGNLTSLTISFPEWADNEWPLAQQTARHLRIRAIHKELSVEGIHLLPAIMGHFDEPFADSSALPTAIVCQTAREDLTVALSGDGGDEVFAGYENHVRAWNWRHLDLVPLRFRKPISHFVSQFTKPDSRAKRFFKRLEYPVGTWGMGAKLYPFEDWIVSFLKPEFRLSIEEIERILAVNVPRWPNASPVDEAQRTDIRLYMLDDILVKVDRMSMRSSVEVRSPFLDFRLVELALKIPPELRVKGGINKYLLRRLADRYLPKLVTTAPKRGFGIPLDNWLFNSAYAKFFRAVLCSSSNSVLDPLLPKKGEVLWAMAERNASLVVTLFRILAFYWWQKSNLS